MKTYSEIFVEWSDLWVRTQREKIGARLEKLMREKFNLDEDVKIIWMSDSPLPITGIAAIVEQTYTDRMIKS